MRIHRSLSIVLLLFGVFGCSSDKADYSKIQDVLSANEQLFESTEDFDTRISLSENSMSTIQDFLKEHREGEWHDVAQAAFEIWQQRSEEARNSMIAESDYLEVSSILDSNERDFEKLPSVGAKINVCESSISAIQSFLDRHSNQKPSNIARTSLSIWKQRQERLQIRTSAKYQYSEVERVLSSNQKLFEGTLDLDTRISLCESSISKIEQYISRHTQGEWPDIARASLSTWNERMLHIGELKAKLYEDVYSLLQSNCEKAAKKRHPLSNIVETILADRKESKIGNNPCITDTYEIRMKGAILGHSIYKLTTKVTGCINISSHTVSIFGEVELTE